MNYFKFAYIDNKKKKILENAKWEGFKVKKHEMFTDKTFETTDYNISYLFVFNKKIYHITTFFSGVISGFFELNMSKENCLSGKNGVYYELLERDAL